MERAHMRPTKRIIPKILVQWNERKRACIAVTTVGYSSVRTVGSAVNQARIFESNGCDELAVILISPEAPDDAFLQVVGEIADSVYTPIAVGGNLHSVSACLHLVESGADKLILGTAATLDGLSTEASALLGEQALIGSLDYFESTGLLRNGQPLREALAQLPKLGIGELLLNSIERDGTREGYDLKGIELAASLVELPIIAGTGCGSGNDAAAAFASGADAAAMGTLLAFSDQNPMQIRAHVANEGHHVRMNR
jgi:cyclase